MSAFGLWWTELTAKFKVERLPDHMMALVVTLTVTFLSQIMVVFEQVATLSRKDASECLLFLNY